MNMNLEQCYKAMDGDYEEAKRRLRADRLIVKFLRKFADDPSFSRFEAAIAAHDDKAAFLALHTIKGVAQNLSMTALYQKADALCELFRFGWSDEGAAKANELKTEYERVMTAIERHVGYEA